jgi:non-canonical purine NTP pyrophosphatase (RdgB/HAM1 family)
METITFITGNPGKASLLRQYLDYPVIHKAFDLVEVQSLDLATIVEHKAKEAYRQVRGPVLVEDTALLFYTLGRLPGPLIKWFLMELGTDGLCRLLDNYADRSAVAEVLYGLFDGRSFQTFSGAVEGTIASSPRGSGGFGWDDIFIPAGFEKTWAEMKDEEVRADSMRRIALRKLEAYLKN